MTMFQRDKVKYYLRNGDPLPLPKISQKKYTAEQQYEDQLASQIIMRAKSARKRSLDMIKASGAFEHEKYYLVVKSFIAFKSAVTNFDLRFVPIKHLREPSNIQKIRLQELMSGLKHNAELNGVTVKNIHKQKQRAKPVTYDPIKSCKVFLIHKCFRFYM